MISDRNAGLETAELQKIWQKSIFVVFLLIVAGSVVYFNSLSNSFQYDDQVVVEYNKHIRTLRNVPSFFTTPRMMTAILYKGSKESGHYRPLVVTSYAIDYAIGGLNPAGYHIVNLAFHICSAFLIFLIVKAVLGRGNSGFRTALAAGLIFLVHPFNSEAVNYITARSSLMSGFFYLLGFYFWVKFRETAGNKRIAGNLVSSHFLLYIASCLAFFLGMLSKEVMITLPIMLWLYDLYFTPRVTVKLRTLFNWRVYVAYLPFVIIGILPYLAIRIFSFGSVLPTFQRDVWTQFLTMMPVLVKHLQMFFVPFPLTPIHHVEIYKTFLAAPVIGSIALLLIYLSVTIILCFSPQVKWRSVSFFMLWFFVVLLPTTIIPLNAIFQENRGYLASVLFAVSLAVLIGELQGKRFQTMSVALLCIVLVVYSVITIQRNMVWKDELTLWSDAAKKDPASAEVLTALGIAFRRGGMYNQAVAASNKALELGGNRNFVAHENLGMVYLSQRKWGTAARELELAIQGSPYKPQTHYNIALVYSMLGRASEAEAQYKEAIRLDDEYIRSYFDLGVLYLKQRRWNEAVQVFRKVLYLQPGHLNALFFMGISLEQLGQKRDAIGYYREVVRLGGATKKILVEEAGRRAEMLGGKL